MLRGRQTKRRPPPGGRQAPLIWGGEPPSLGGKKSNKINNLDDMTEDIYKPIADLSSTKCMPSVSALQGGIGGGTVGAPYGVAVPVRARRAGHGPAPSGPGGDRGRPAWEGAPPGRAPRLAAMRAGSPPSSRRRATGYPTAGGALGRFTIRCRRASSLASYRTLALIRPPKAGGWGPGFRPRIKYGVTFLRRNDGRRPSSVMCARGRESRFRGRRESGRCPPGRRPPPGDAHGCQPPQQSGLRGPATGSGSLLDLGNHKILPALLPLEGGRLSRQGEVLCYTFPHRVR